MKVCIIQPEYSTSYERSDELFEKQLEYLSLCDESMDIILLPESCDVPCLAKTKEEAEASYRKYNEPLLRAAKETAKRCGAAVFLNARSDEGSGLRNTTYAIDKEGNIIGKYFKQHLTPGEVSVMELDSDYTFEHSEPYVLELCGYKFAFLTCYDFYFYEAVANIARYSPDFIIGCSHQRSDTNRALTMFSQFTAYNTNAYVLRSSVSMGEDSTLGGGSMVVAPDGEVLLNMHSRIGMECVEIDPRAKYFKPAGFGNPPAAHYQYIEKGRRPYKYRPAGSSIVLSDSQMAYPRVCAHRGFNRVAPENSMPAFGAAIAMGAEEIEFDIWFTKDGVPVSIHDSTLERVSNGEGKVWEYTLEELRRLDFGIKRGEDFGGMKIPTLEDILKKFACQCVMNVHIKTAGDKPEYLDTVAALIKKYDCEKHVYFMCGRDAVLEILKNKYPEIPRCCGAGDGKWEIVDRAIKYGCSKVQLMRGYFNREMIEKAHSAGIVCNVFYSDDPKEALEFIDMGVDVILTNNYNLVANAVSSRSKYLFTKR